VRDFNLMLGLNVGPYQKSRRAYLRPETAQTIFMNYKFVLNAMRAKLPFGIAQIGRSYRNEISPRQGLIRMREFTQMEIETFVDPEQIMEHPTIDQVRDVVITFIDQPSQLTFLAEGGEEPQGTEITVGEALDRGLIINPYLAYYMGVEEQFYRALGVPHDHIRFRHMTPQETPFYSGGNYDVEVNTSIGWKEVIGNAYRTDHDLSVHMKHSKTKLEYSEGGRRFIPHNVEPSFGVERAFYCALEHAYVPEGTDREWAWFRFPVLVAPYAAGVFPLMKKEELAGPAFELYERLKKAGLPVYYDKSGSIGKRYQRADEIGVPYSITIDYESIEGSPSTVTVRDRDSTRQIRVPTDTLVKIIGGFRSGDLSFFEAGPEVVTRGEAA
jgi:glycyl-tRNA synthetase